MQYLFIFFLVSLLNACQVDPEFWYNSNKQELKTELTKWQDEYDKQKKIFNIDLNQNSIFWLIVPHAGYKYVGPILTQAYVPFYNLDLDKIIILSPLHQASNKIFAPDCKNIQTVLGKLKTSTIPGFKITKLPKEHAFSNQLPFLFKLQRSIRKNPIVYPVFIGNSSEEDLNYNLDQLQKFITPKTLIIVSSDLTHLGKRFKFTPNISQTILDNNILKSISNLDINEFEKSLDDAGHTVCGEKPLNFLIKLLKKLPILELRSKTLVYDNSKNIFPSHDQNDDSSVGYGVIFGSGQLLYLTNKQKINILEYTKSYFKILLKSKSITDLAVSKNMNFTNNLPNPYGLFVTIKNKKNNHELRGCLGLLKSNDKNFLQQLNSRIKALAEHQDTRFKKISLEEYSDLTFEISILMNPEKTDFNLFDINDGLILNHLKDGFKYNSIYIPGVIIDAKWDKLKAFEQLSLKAGLSTDDWKKANFQSIKSMIIK